VIVEDDDEDVLGAGAGTGGLVAARRSRSCSLI
jgi:hypothetical protein